ncbi:hypothetical protein [Azospirillum sp. B506]|uniref:hypothetical protein n=1 Tax=Azospirillum sp. B506 TaxID=137721 RepID=UPI001FCB5CCA|nr:hypothetical protein [Azospirillum sp. B506]
MLLQSSTATGLMATGFTATGLVSLIRALAVMLGGGLLSWPPIPVSPPIRCSINRVSCSPAVSSGERHGRNRSCPMGDLRRLRFDLFLSPAPQC